MGLRKKKSAKPPRLEVRYGDGKGTLVNTLYHGSTLDLLNEHGRTFLSLLYRDGVLHIYPRGIIVPIDSPAIEQAQRLEEEFLTLARGEAR